MLNVKFSFGSLNVRGLKDIVKRKALFLFLKGQKTQINFLQETHSSDMDTSFWANQWGDKILFSHGSNRSGGVAICFNNCPGEIVTHRTDGEGHWLAVVIKMENLFIIVINVYGYNNDGQNKTLLNDLTDLISELKGRFLTDYILLGGDWNMTPDEWCDRWPSRLGKPQFNYIINNFVTDNNLTDVWRNFYPDARSYSWFKPNGSSMSRLDFWLVSNDILNYSTGSSISKAPLTDHCFIDLFLEPTVKKPMNKGFWKFNANLLHNEDYCSKIREIIRAHENNETIDNDISRWEFFKFKVREFTIRFSKEVIRKKKEYESNLLWEINQCCNKPDLNELEKTRIMELQIKLDELYLERARGAFVRSRAKWIEAGEKNSSYFCNLEKNRQKRNSINSLLINGLECKDQKIIEREVYSFYSNLYSSNYSQTDSDLFFDKIHKFIPQIEDSFKEICEAEFKIEELDEIITKMSPNKSPGTDGLTTNFYQFFWNDLRQFLYKALRGCIHRKELMTSMKQGLITLIPKTGKDKRILDNLRPITLLNTDYKIFSGAVAFRLKEGISSIISETQSGFLKNRSIHNNIRLVLDLLEYKNEIDGGGFLLFLDFYKAFDRVEHPFIIKTLHKFGFGKKFLNIIGMLYNEINSSVALGHGTCSRFQIKRGIRQGCGSSPLLFIMVAEMLSLLIKNSDIEGLEVMGRLITISQLADDTTLFLKNADQIPLALQAINHFSKASGLQLNLDKCEILTLHEHPLQPIYNIKVKKEAKYLGIVISKDDTVSEQKNIWVNIDKCKSILNRWSQRDLSIFGRILLTKMDSLSRLIYPAFSLPLKDKMIKQINSINFNFIWKNKCHYIRKDDMVKSYEEGGGNVIDFDTMNGVLKVKWLKSYIQNKQSIWFIIPNLIFQKMGGIEFLLRCDFNNNRLPIKLSAFHQQVLLYWKLIYKHNFTPHNTPIWNNRYVLQKNKSIYLEEWFTKGVWAVAHLMDDEGNLLKFEHFCEKYQLVCTFNFFNKMIKAIPNSVRAMVKEDIVHSKILPKMRPLCIQGTDLHGEKCTNKFLRHIFLQQLYPNSIKRKYVLQDYKENEIQKIRKSYISYPLPPKVKELNFKILNEIYPTKHFLNIRFNIEMNNCTFCEKDTETLHHLFFDCDVSHAFWSDMWSWLQSKNINILPFSVRIIKFGIFVSDKDVDLVINYLILLGKFFIHKCRYFKSKPSLKSWLNEFKLFSKSLKFVKEKKAMKLHSLLNNLNLI